MRNQLLRMSREVAQPCADQPVALAMKVTSIGTFALLGFGLVAPSLAMETAILETNALESVGPLTEPDSHASNPENVQSKVSKLELYLSERRLAVYSGDMLIANYSVAVGREGWQTPTGEFSVFQKQRDPAWEHPFTGDIIPPGPGNPLGSRWIGFWSDGQNSIGFHGTPDESVIGSAVSHGCVRMRNEDVLALYEQVSMDTPVIVLP